MREQGKPMTYQQLSVTITACDRLDLLERTINSFKKYNTYPIEELIIRDDSGLKEIWSQTSKLLDKGLPFAWKLLDHGQVGQAKSIDLLMEQVTTPYVFHLEDDWEFDRPGFIEDCFKVLSDDIAQVSVRHQDDGSARTYRPYNDVADEVLDHRFSFNPHLRRTNLIGKFEGMNETILGELMHKRWLKTLTLKRGACRHIGGDKTTNRSGTPYSTGVQKA